jgi:endogenous inhibitor of DNA gyrase (YacG/DUF329 family)
MAGATVPKQAAGGRGCPVCGKPADARFRPFCSGRCADIDLHRWFQGSYAIPAVEPPDEGEEGGVADPETRPDKRNPER